LIFAISATTFDLVLATYYECSDENVDQGGRKMLWTIFVILLVLWLVGLVSFHAIGAYIHILLVLALVVLLIQLISGRRGVV
jgi:Family of unknown function (DUF5670)